MNHNHSGPNDAFSAQTINSLLRGKTILVTGGTGSFGQRFVRRLLKTQVGKIIVFSRDELKQMEMHRDVPDAENRLRFFIGDIRDKDRVYRAFSDVDFVVHAAALKQVPTLEYNPFEAVQTNILGAENIINAAIDQNVERIVALSTDKAVNPVNLYGATKLCMEKLFVAGNSYAGKQGTRFSAVRYGNVFGSRGSVVPLFLARRKDGVVPITDDRMTRFWITLDQGVEMVLGALASMHGGEIFVPKIPSMRVTDLAQAIAPGCRLQPIGVRPGEKIHETLLTEDEAARTLDAGTFYVIPPLFPWWGNGKWQQGTTLPKDFRYSSDSNQDWLGPDKLAVMVSELIK